MLEQIKTYADARGLDRSAFIRYALDKVFTSEGPKPDTALEQAIRRWINVPFNMPVRAFYGILYLMSTRYPDLSAKEFWTEAAYVGPRDVTHRELLKEIRRDHEAYATVRK